MNDKHQKDLQERSEKFSKEKQALLEKYNLKETINIDFPKYRELPPEVTLAALVFENHGGTYIALYSNLKEVKNE